jgi:hypothetical protein
VSERVFFPLFVLLHLVLVGLAILAYLHYGWWATLLVVLAGIGALQAWLQERRKARRYQRRR